MINESHTLKRLRTMKKKYINPSLQTTELNVIQPLAQSNIVNSTGNNININPSTMQGGNGGDGAKSRNNGAWNSLW